MTNHTQILELALEPPGLCPTFTYEPLSLVSSLMRSAALLSISLA